MPDGKEKLTLEEELELARENREYLESKRGEIEQLLRHKNNQGDKPKKKSFSCCSILILVLVSAIGLIVYFIYNIRGPMKSEYDRIRDFIVQPMDQVPKPEIDKTIDNIIASTSGEVKQLENTYNTAKDTYNQASELLNQGKAAVDSVNKLKDTIDNAVK